MGGPKRPLVYTQIFCPHDATGIECDMSRSRYQITLHPEGDGPPVTIRLRTALKDLLRRHGLRCSDIRRLDAPEVDPGEASPGAGTLERVAQHEKRVMQRCVTLPSHTGAPQ